MPASCLSPTIDSTMSRVDFREIGPAMNLHESAKRRADALATETYSADRLAVTKFAIGQSVPRSEDPMLLRGQGRYTDDVSLPGQAYAVMVRSRHGHGVIRAINAEAAREKPGV